MEQASPCQQCFFFFLNSWFTPFSGIKKEATEIGTIHSLGSLFVYNIDQQFTIHVVNAVSGKEVQKIDVNLKGKKDQNSVVATIKEVKLVPNEQVLVLPSSCDQLRLYGIKSGSLTRELNEFNMIQNMGLLQLTDDGRKAATIDMHEIAITDLETGDVEHCLRSPVMRMQYYTRDGVHFFSVGVDQVLRVYDRSLEDLDENKGEISVMEYEVKDHGRSYRYFLGGMERWGIGDGVGGGCFAASSVRGVFLVFTQPKEHKRQ